MTTLRWTFRELGLGYLLIAWVGVAFYLTTVMEPQIRLELHYQESIAQSFQEPAKLVAFERRLERQLLVIEELGGELRKVKCQINMVVAASRAGWRKAERLMRTGRYIETCGTDRWKDSSVAVVAAE